MKRYQGKWKLNLSGIVLTIFMIAFTAIFVVAVREISYRQEVENLKKNVTTAVDGIGDFLRLSATTVQEEQKRIIEEIAAEADASTIYELCKSKVNNSGYEYVIARHLHEGEYIMTDEEALPDDMRDAINKKLERVGEGSDSHFLFRSNEQDYSVVIYILPVYKDGNDKGTLIAVKKYEDIFNGTELTLKNEYNGYYAIDRDGNLVNYLGKLDENSEELNLITHLKGHNFTRGTLKKFKEDLKYNRSGYVVTQSNKGSHIFMYICTDRDTGYFSVFIGSEALILNDSGRIVAYALYMSIFFILIVIGVLFVFRRNEKKLSERIHRLAYIDTEFDSYNMNYLSDNYDEILKHRNTEYSYVSFDVNNFRGINNTFGYTTGTNVLKTICQELDKEFSIDNEEIAIHINGDNFGILVKRTDSVELFERIDQFFDNLSNKIYEDFSNLFNVDFSAGIYNIEAGVTTLRGAIDGAELARKDVKNNYFKNIEYFDNNLKEKIKEKLEIENDMKAALENEEFQVYIQPKINMVTASVHGAEALVRWKHKTKGLIMPSKFIPIFEENGFIIQLDFYMFEKICQLKNQWRDKGIESYCISVNMSRLHLNDENFVDTLVGITKKYNIRPSEIELEVTENILFGDMDRFVQVMLRLKEIGFRLSVDDFGSAYSSLNILKDLPLDIVKLDRMFLSEGKNREKSLKIIKNIITMLKDLKLEIVMEGIETREQAELITGYGCEIAQGFYYARPMEVSKYLEFIEKNSKEAEKEVIFRFRDDLKDETGVYEGVCVGEEVSYCKGLKENERAVVIPGGDIVENYISMPTELLDCDSYTICFWLQYNNFYEWQSVIYAAYENGFMAVNPRAIRSLFIYRNVNNSVSDEWYDVMTNHVFVRGRWYHVAISYNAKTEVSRLCVNGEPMGYRYNVPKQHNVNRIMIGADIYQRTSDIKIANMRFSNVVKPSREIMEIYQQEKP